MAMPSLERAQAWQPNGSRPSCQAPCTCGRPPGGVCNLTSPQVMRHCRSNAWCLRLMPELRRGSLVFMSGGCGWWWWWCGGGGGGIVGERLIGGSHQSADSDEAVPISLRAPLALPLAVLLTPPSRGLAHRAEPALGRPYLHEVYARTCMCCVLKAHVHVHVHVLFLPPLLPPLPPPIPPPPPLHSPLHFPTLVEQLSTQSS